MIKTLDQTLKSQCKKLDKMTKGDDGEDIGISSESGASAFDLDVEDKQAYILYYRSNILLFT